MKIDGAELESTEWNISKHLNEASSSRIPEDSIMYRNPDGSYGLRFLDYKDKAILDDSNEEEREEMMLDASGSRPRYWGIIESPKNGRFLIKKLGRSRRSH